MRYFLVGLLLAAFSLLHLPQSYAADSYYVEIGRESSEEEAALQWQAYSEKYAQLLKGLEFYPVTVTHQNDNRVGTRIQAGPLRAKLDAYRICGAFFNDGVPCFIVEGAAKPSPAETEAAAVDLPWLRQKQEEVFAPAPVEVLETQSTEDSRPGFFSRIFGSDDDNISTADAKQGDVEVAEAIRVPLTRDTTPRFTPKPEFVKEAAPASSLPPAAPEAVQASAMQPDGNVWLNIRHFQSEDTASAFWQAVRAADPVQTAGFRVRVVKPFLEAATQAVSLNVGPFADNGDARTFCHTIIQSRNSELGCEIAVSGQENAESRLITQPFEHSKRYENRRKRHNARHNRREGRIISENSRTKVYWVQVAVAESQMQALQTWDDLREAHPDLLEGLRSSVSATLMRGSKYMVRVGPLESGSAATELCSSLTGRGVPCRIYSNM